MDTQDDSIYRASIASRNKSNGYLKLLQYLFVFNLISYKLQL